jgi:glycosyltransferase involved in cell wall biosynthesis
VHSFSIASWFYQRLIAVSKHVENEIIKNCSFMARQRLVVIPNGVDTNHFSPVTKTDLSAPLKIISVSRISKEKNLEYLIESLSHFKSLEIPFQWTHVGSAKTENEFETLQMHVVRADLGSHTRFVGFQADPVSFIQEADVFINPSFTEGHPVAVLEAMAAGKICLLSDIPPHRELSSDGVEYFSLSDPAHLSNLLKQVAADRDGFEKRSVHCRQVVLQNFSLKHMISNYASVYEA